MSKNIPLLTRTEGIGQETKAKNTDVTKIKATSAKVNDVTKIKVIKPGTSGETKNAGTSNRTARTSFNAANKMSGNSDQESSPETGATTTVAPGTDPCHEMLEDTSSSIKDDPPDKTDPDQETQIGKTTGGDNGKAKAKAKARASKEAVAESEALGSPRKDAKMAQGFKTGQPASTLTTGQETKAVPWTGLAQIGTTSAAETKATGGPTRSSGKHRTAPTTTRTRHTCLMLTPS
jgi:hypothetical protein